MTENHSFNAGTSFEQDFYVQSGISGGRFGNTRSYSSKDSNNEGNDENKHETPPKNSPRMESKGKAKFGEVRKTARERRRFVQRRRGLIFTVAILCFSVLLLLLIYQFVFVVNNISIVGDGIYTSETLLEASGVRTGVNLYSFRASTVEKRLTFNCPYIKTVEINRKIPNKVTITVTEDIPVYYTVIFGEYKILSEGLRILDTVSDKSEIPEGLIRLNLPGVSYAITGRVLKFADEKRERGVRDVLEIIKESSLYDRVTTIDIRDQFDMYTVCDRQFKLVLGKEASLEYKLNVAAKVLEDEMFITEDKILVDLTTEGKTGVVVDNMMELE